MARNADRARAWPGSRFAISFFLAIMVFSLVGFIILMRQAALPPEAH